jgi:hypothetical protein
MHRETLQTRWWRLPVALTAFVGLASALVVVGAPLWISAFVGGLAAVRIAMPFPRTKGSYKLRA